MVAGLNRWLHRVSLGAAYLAAVALAVSVGVTVADIALRRAIDAPIPGVVDLTQLCVMWAAFLSIPVAFHLDNHISVVLFTDRLSPERRRRVFCAGAFASAIFLAVACWASAAKAVQEFATHDRSMILGVPLIWYWVPVILGFGLSAACALGRGLEYAQAREGDAAPARPVGGPYE